LSKQPRSKPKATLKTSKKSRVEPKKAKPKAEKKTVKVVEKKAAKKVEKTTPISPPIAIVSRALGPITKFRRGRGFSRSELHTVSLDVGRARKLGLRVDLRRSTELSKNVEALKKWYTAPKVTSKAVKKVSVETKAKAASKARK
jgi:ribosomal protein L13E